MIDKLEKKLYYNIMTCESIFILLGGKTFGREKKCKKTEKKENT